MINKKIKLQVTKQLQQIADDIGTNITKVVEDKLLETYKTNVQLSYSPRSEEGNYVSTGTFIDSIYTEVEKTNSTTTISVMVADVPYENGKSTTDVHTFLTEGTKGGGEYPYETPEGKIQFAHNYPTPQHMFEEHTVTQMQGFLEGLENDIKTGKYNK